MHSLLLALMITSGPRTVLVLDLSVRDGISRDLGQTLSELMVVEVRKVAVGQRIYGAADIKTLVGFKQQKSMLGCEDSSCLAELGGAMGANEIINGSLSLIGDEYVLVLRRLDVARSRVVSEASENVPKDSAAKLQHAARKAVDQLFGVGGVSAEATASGESRSKVLPLVLGGGAVVALGAAVVGWVFVSEFESMRSSSSGPTSTVTYAQAQNAQSLASVGMVMGIAGIAVAAGLGTGAALTW